MNTVNQIREGLLSVPPESIFVLSLRQAVQNGQTEAAIKSIYEQTQDNRPLVVKMIGEALVKKVELCYS